MPLRPERPPQRVQFYAATRPQDGNAQNEDAFLIGREAIPYAALCDGSGHAQRAAQHALRLFERLFSDVSTEQVCLFSTWEGWAQVLDSALLGGPQSTFLACAVVGDRLVGACAGDSRMYLLRPGGEVQILTEEASKHRLGSGLVHPFAIHWRLIPGDIVLLMSDGAWTPLGLPKLQALQGRFQSSHESDIPGLLLDEAGRRGRADDMTVVAIVVR